MEISSASTTKLNSDNAQSPFRCFDSCLLTSLKVLGLFMGFCGICIGIVYLKHGYPPGVNALVSAKNAGYILISTGSFLLIFIPAFHVVQKKYIEPRILSNLKIVQAK